MAEAQRLRRVISEMISPPRNLSVSEWADKYRQLPSDSPEPGKFKTSRVPYMREVMQAINDPVIKRIAVRSASQIGKSEVLLNIVGRTAHLNPSNIMIIQPTLEMAQDFSKSRLSKMIADTKVLTPLFYEKEKTRDANQTILSKFYRGGRVTLVGANSPAGLASRPIRILLCDEVDRYPVSAGKEGDPISIAEKRTSNYWDAKVALFSTPTMEGTSRIDIEYNLGTQEEWSHQCPNCGEWHFLNAEEMTTDYDEQKDEAGNRFVIIREVKWRCPDCGHEYEEKKMKQTAQRYVMKNEAALKNGMRSFWINGFTSPWVPWQAIMREWLEAQGNATREAVVMNTRFGQSYRPTEMPVVEATEARCEKYDGEIPTGVRMLTAGVDVQGNRLHYHVMGFSGDEIWGIRCGVIYGKPTQKSLWTKLREELNKTYKKKDGTALKVARTFIDSGYATEYVYKYVRENTGVYAVKGLGTPGIPLIHKYSALREKGLILVVLGVNDGKAQVFSQLEKMHFGQDDEMARNYDANFFREMTSERRILKRHGGTLVEVYEKTRKDARNEALDTTVYALAAYESLREVKKKSQAARHKQIDIWS